MTEPISLTSLGGTGLLASPITIGTSGLGVGSIAGDEADRGAIELARAVLAGPYALVDTSNVYAAGRSEEVLGRAGVAQLEAPRALVTKVDRDLASGVFDADRVLRSFDESCERLGVERIPLLHLHDPYTVSFEEATAPKGALAGLLRLKAEGRVGAIGVAAGRIAVMNRYVDTGEFDAVLTHNRFTLVDQSARALIENAAARGMAVFNAAPFGGSLLARGAAQGGSYNYRPASPELLEWVARVEEIAAAYGVSLPAVALHFSLRSSLIHSTVVGVSHPERLASLEELRTTSIPDEVWEQISRLGAAPSPIVD